MADLIALYSCLKLYCREGRARLLLATCDVSPGKTKQSQVAVGKAATGYKVKKRIHCKPS